MSSSTHMLFTGWEVRIERNCARGIEYHGTVSRNTDRARPVNNILFFFPTEI